MTIVAGRNRANRPYFFTSVDGERVEFPAMSEGIGDLDGAELNRFEKLVSAGQIDVSVADEPKAEVHAVEVDDAEVEPEAEPIKKRGRPRKDAG